MRKILFTITITTLFIRIDAQNLVKNGGFEFGSCVPDNEYNVTTSKGLTFLNCLNHWGYCGSRNPYTSHSPDWFRDPLFNNAQEGTRFVHMVNYEAIQQKIPNAFVDGSNYWISVWIKLNSFLGGGPRNFNTAALNIYLGGSGALGNSRFEYEDDPNPGSAFDNCNLSYRQLNAKDKKLIKQIDLSTYPKDEWVQIHFVYEYKDSRKHDIIAIELIDTDAENKVLNCQTASICLDNIEIIDACQHPCVSDWAPEVIYHPTVIIDGIEYIEIQELHDFDHTPFIKIGSYIYRNRTPIVRIDIDTKNTVALIENAHRIVFRVWNRWGENIFEKLYFDSNYLRNGNSARIFNVAWNGENYNNIVSQLGAYPAYLKVETCQGYSEEFYFIIMLADGHTEIQPYPIPWVQNPMVIGCCEPDGLIINDQISTLKVKHEFYIILSNGAQILQDGNVELISGSYVQLESESEVLFGSVFECFQQKCEYGLPNDVDLKTTVKPTELNLYRNEYQSLEFFPNPIEDVLNIISTVSIKELSIISIKGELVYNERNINATNVSIRIPELVSGVYMCSLSLNNGNIHYEKIIVN